MLANQKKIYRNVYLIYTCNKYEYRVKILNNHYKQNVKSPDVYFFVIGNSHTDYVYDNMIYLNCGDLYENLPHKVVMSFIFCVTNFNFEKIFKIDDDIFINFNKIRELNFTETKYNYFGKQTPPTSQLVGNRWHINKLSKNNKYNKTVAPNFMFPFNRTQLFYYPCGGFYIISKHNCELIFDYYEQNSNFVKNHIYEDILIYKILSENNIMPTFFDSNMWLSVNLKEIDQNIFEIISDKNKININIHNYISIHCGSLIGNYNVDELLFKKIFEFFMDLTLASRKII